MVNSLTQDRIVNKYSTGSLLPAFLLILGFIVVSGLLHTVESRRTHHHYSDESDSNQHSRTGLSNAQDIQNANKIETEQQCKHYLCKYGYLDCNCTSYIMKANGRYKRQASLGSLIPTELDQPNPYEGNHEATYPPMLTTPSSQNCQATHLKQGFEGFQQMYRLNITGYCDGITKRFMSRSRCGQPDMFNIDEITGYDSREHQEMEFENGRHSNSDDGSDSSESSSSSEERDSPSKHRSHMGRNRRSSSLNELIAPATVVNDRFSENSVKRRAEQLLELIAMQSDNHTTYNEGKSTRTKRSFGFSLNEPIGKLNKARITWRLMSAHTNPSIPVDVQNAILAQAFRYWSEVAPLCFKEDKNSRNVDVEVGFLEGTHLNCYKQFDGLGGEIAHKFYRDVHFDKTDPYTASITTRRSAGISLLLVAVHEIGHVLGLNHSKPIHERSVMNAIYHRNIHGRFELSNYDREEISKMYGKCGGTFDIVMDYVRNSGNTRVFNTYFFRGGSFWMYENTNGRTRYGDPKMISDTNWNGLPSNLDTYVHYFEPDRNGRNGVSERYFFFQGANYYQYDPELDRVAQTGRIGDLFRRGPNGFIPNNLNAAFFEYATKLIFFFKGRNVYKYDFKLRGSHQCCTERPMLIETLFPPATRGDRYSPSGATYTANLDAVYLSWTAPYHLYLIKGDDVWQVKNYSIFGPYNESRFRAKYIGKWNSIWHYICEADCPA